MKLSEAIRLGAMLKPQAYTSYSETGSCAIEAAIEAIGRSLSAGYQHPLFEAWPWVKTLKSVCPECQSSGAQEYTIWHLNDDHKWTRERIADFVATIEQQLEAQATPQLEVAHVTH